MYDKIYSKEFLEESKMEKNDFTRDRKMSFPKLIIFILSGTKKSLQSALFAFTSRFKFENGTYTKQAFSKARKKINPKAFYILFRESVELFYRDAKYRRYRGYRVTAIDGTKYNLPGSEELMRIYGSQGHTNNQVQALGSCLYDVLNGILIDVLISPFDSNERVLAKKHIEELSGMKSGKELLLLDRGYPSADLLSFIEEKGFKYVVRSSSTFIAGIKSEGNDFVVKHSFGKSETLKLRIIRFTLNDSTEEVLITNIFDKSFTTEDFANIYHMRWGIEEKYDD